LYAQESVRRSRRGLLFLRLRQIVHVKDYSDHETAAGTHSNLFTVAQIIDGDLEAVAARARVCVCLEGGIVGHVLQIVKMSAKSALRHDKAWSAYLDLNLVVNVLLRHNGGAGEDFVKRLKSSLRCIESIRFLKL
jgi:hypothetical protein